MIIDFHTHCFPDKISKMAIERLSYSSGGIEHFTDGTCKGLLNSMGKSGVDLSVVLNIATNARQMENVNNFASSISNEENIFSFGSVYPFADNAIDELRRIKSLGLKGVKLHPDYQGFSVDDVRLKPLYHEISVLGLIVVFHTGYDYGFNPPYGATPSKMSRALSWIDSPVVAAHWGALNMSIEVVQHLCGKDIYFDTSMGYGCMPKSMAQKIIEKHGTEKILFGTDSPWHTAEMELKFLNSMNLSKDEMDSITHLNALKLLKNN